MEAARGSLEGRVALVTGGSRGIGAAIARELAAAGATVAVNYRSDRAAADAVAGELGGDATAWRADVAVADEAARLVADVVDRHGRLDLVVANAGVWRGGRMETLTEEDWRTVVDTSLLGAFHVLRPAIPALRAAGAGSVVVVSSAVGVIGYPGDSAYATAKAGLLGLVRSLAKELGRDGIAVNAVAPGLIDTDMTSEIPDRSRADMIGRTALRRAGTPAEVARAVRFLAEAGYVTGHTLVVDGGFSL